MKMTPENRRKMLEWQRAALEVANVIGYSMVDDRDVSDARLDDIAHALGTLSGRVLREMEEGKR